MACIEILACRDFVKTYPTVRNLIDLIHEVIRVNHDIIIKCKWRGAGDSTACFNSCKKSVPSQ